MDDSRLPSLPLAAKDGDTLFRALLEYEKALRFSSLRDSTLVHDELTRVRELQERLSLVWHYPAGAGEQ